MSGETRFSLSHQFSPHRLGQTFEDNEITVFFGHAGSDLAALAPAFPDYVFKSLRQTHSDIAVYTSRSDRADREGDAHFSHEPRLALVVQTADCIPLFIQDRDSGMIAAIHAGWRGVENAIICKAGLTLQTTGVTLDRARAFIGPHIAADSFEVDNDVAAKLSASFELVRGFSGESSALRSHHKPEKKFVSLVTIARAQLASIGITQDRVLEAGVDTFSSHAHNSFRRQRSASGRQLSFIAKKN